MAINKIVMGDPEGRYRLEASTNGRSFQLWDLTLNVMIDEKTFITERELHAWLAAHGIEWSTLRPI